MTFEQILSHFKAHKVGNSYKAKCPAHTDNKASLSISPGRSDGKTVINCFAGCDTEAILDAADLALTDLFAEPLPPRETSSRPGRPNIKATYDYQDESGKLLFQAVRFEPKDFRQRQPKGNEWVWNLEGVRKVLFHLPQLLQSQWDATVLLVEGEADVLAAEALGFVATCNPMGAGKWNKEYSESLKGRKVCILPDNDEPGRKHAAAVKKALMGVAESVKVLALPGLPEKGDLRDWIAAGGTADELLALLEDLDGGPELYADPKQCIKTLAGKVWAIWRRVEQANPRHFLYAGTPVRVQQMRPGRYKTEMLSVDSLSYQMRRVARWFVFRKPTPEEKLAGSTEPIKIPADVPQNLVKDLLSTPTAEIDLPELWGFSGAPLFTADKRFLYRAGYDRQSKIYLTRDYDLPPLPTEPTPEDLDNALGWIADLLIDFPFASQTDKAHAISLLFTPLVRQMIDGPTPAHAAMSPKAGTGKGLLVEVLLDLATGGSLHVITAPTGEDEWRKQLLSSLVEAYPAILIDNVNVLRSSALQAVLTAREFSGRILGRTGDVTAPVNCTWAITGNNLEMDDDSARRTLTCYLDSGLERPEERDPADFTHPDIRVWADKNRNAVLHSCAVLVQHWIAKGCPSPKWTPTRTPKGSYEHHSRVIGGILDTAGIEGFLLRTDDNYSTRSSSDVMVWREIVTEWWSLHQDNPKRPSDLTPIAIEMGLDLGKSEVRRGQDTIFGHKLHKKRNRVFITLGDTPKVLKITSAKATDDKGRQKDGYKLEVRND